MMTGWSGPGNRPTRNGRLGDESCRGGSLCPPNDFGQPDGVERWTGNGDWFVPRATRLGGSDGTGGHGEPPLRAYCPIDGLGCANADTASDWPGRKRNRTSPFLADLLSSAAEGHVLGMNDDGGIRVRTRAQTNLKRSDAGRVPGGFPKPGSLERAVR